MVVAQHRTGAVVRVARTSRRVLHRSLAGLAGGGLALAACGPQPGREGSRAEGRAVTLSWWGYPRLSGRDATGGPGMTEQEWMDARAEELHARFGNLTVQPTLLTWAEGRQKTEVAFASDTAPDLYHDSNPLLLKWALKNALEPLKGQLETRDYLDIIVKGVSVKGTVYAFPWLLSTTGAVLNKTLVDEAGATDMLPKAPDYGWVLDDYLELARRLKRGDVWGTLNNTGGHGVFGWLQAFGGRVFSEDGKKCTLNSPECQEGWNFFLDLDTRYGVAPPRDENTSSYWWGKRVAIMYGSPGLRRTRDNNVQAGQLVPPFELYPAQNPRHKRLARRGWETAMDGFSIFKQSDEAKLKLALETARFLTNADNSRMVKHANFYPARTSLSDLYKGDEWMTAFGGFIQYAHPDFWHPYWVDIRNNHFNPLIPEVAKGTMAPKQALEEMTKAADRFLAENPI
ncbi:MAG TPA: extracellular solute-binding protein [Chloroflexota bacterium]|nr:extracellular solute-binding protein [Chloroflexota bacterium]